MRKLSDSPAARRRRERKDAEVRAAALARAAAPFGHSWPNDLTGIVHDPADCPGKGRACVHIPKQEAPGDETTAAWFRIRKLWPRLDVRLSGGAGEKRVIVCHHVRGALSSSVIGKGYTWAEAIANAITYAKSKGYSV